MTTAPDRRATATRLAQAAIANGTHSERRLHVCGGCGRWVDSLFHKTQDGKLVGVCCTPKGEIKRVEDIAAAEAERRKGGRTA